MDKQTLSNYGWIVIAVLVLAVMIALATPFGTYIKSGVETTTQGLFDTSEKAMNVVGMSAKGENPLKEKNIAVFGTSISNNNSTLHRDIPTYIEIVAEKNEMTLSNYAQGGHNMIQIYNKYSANKSALLSFGANDYVIFEGPFNSFPLDLGELTAEGTTTFNINTFIGSLESIMYEYGTSGCKAKVGLILCFYTETMNKNPEKYDSFYDAAILVCEKYNIPYLDLRNESYSCVDDVHPDVDGNIMMSKSVEKWLRTL